MTVCGNKGGGAAADFVTGGDGDDDGDDGGKAIRASARVAVAASRVAAGAVVRLRALVIW